MFRRLTAVEIAEGALLADIALTIQLLSVYLPFLHLFFRALVPIVFALLVLRRDLHVGIMALCVVLFLTGVMTGPSFLLPLLMAAAMGLYMGAAMKHRVSHLVTLAVGVTAGSIVLWGQVFVLTLLAGLPVTDIALWLQKSYAAALAAVDFITSQVGLGDWWRYSGYPAVDPLIRLALAYWWALYLAILWVAMWPMAIVAYAVTNSFLRLMGHDVQPFPDKRLSRLLRKLDRAATPQRWWRRVGGRRQATP